MITGDKLELEILKKYVAQHQAASIADPQMLNKCARELDMRDVLRDLGGYEGEALQYHADLWLAQLAPSIPRSRRGLLRRCSNSELNSTSHRYNARAYIDEGPGTTNSAWKRIRELESKIPEQGLSVKGIESNFAKNKNIFLAHIFAEEALIGKLKNIIEQNDYHWVEGKRDDLGSISEDILTKIKNCGFFIAVMTKKDELKSSGFTTSSWLIEEKGASLAFGHRPLIMVENGVERHYVGFLQSDDEMIYFNRSNFDTKIKEAIKRIDNTYKKYASQKIQVGKEIVESKKTLPYRQVSLGTLGSKELDVDIQAEIELEDQIQPDIENFLKRIGIGVPYCPKCSRPLEELRTTWMADFAQIGYECKSCNTQKMSERKDLLKDVYALIRSNYGYYWDIYSKKVQQLTNGKPHEYTV